MRDAAYRLIDEAWKKEGPLSDAAVKEMASLARTERDLARQAGSIAGGIRLMLEEMRNNQVAESARRNAWESDPRPAGRACRGPPAGRREEDRTRARGRVRPGAAPRRAGPRGGDR